MSEFKKLQFSGIEFGNQKGVRIDCVYELCVNYSSDSDSHGPEITKMKGKTMKMEIQYKY